MSRLKKMNIDLPIDMELDTVPGTPAEPQENQPFSIRESFRRHLSSSSLLSQSFILRNPNMNIRSSINPASPRVEYAFDPDVSVA